MALLLFPVTLFFGKIFLPMDFALLAFFPPSRSSRVFPSLSVSVFPKRSSMVLPSLSEIFFFFFSTCTLVFALTLCTALGDFGAGFLMDPPSRFSIGAEVSLDLLGVFLRSTTGVGACRGSWAIFCWLANSLKLASVLCTVRLVTLAASVLAGSAGG